MSSLEGVLLVTGLESRSKDTVIVFACRYDNK